MKHTFIASEEYAYPNGGQTRRCMAIWPDGMVRVTWAGISNTYFSIPAHGTLNRRHVRGWVGIQDNPYKPDYGELIFHVSKT